MVNKTLLYRIWHTLFPLRESLFRFRLWSKVILSKGSRCNGTAFEGMNTLMENACVQSRNIGLGTYVGKNFNLQKNKLGRFCSIADYVNTKFGSHPTKCFVTTFPVFYYVMIQKNSVFLFIKGVCDIGKYADPKRQYLVDVGNDVWIGNHVLIIGSVKIGDRAIIAAGGCSKGCRTV